MLMKWNLIKFANYFNIKIMIFVEIDMIDYFTIELINYFVNDIILIELRYLLHKDNLTLFYIS